MIRHLQFGLLLLMVLPFSFAIGQDLTFTQFSNTPLYYNPALTGANEGLHSSTFTRAQGMRQMFAPFKAFNFEGDYGFRSIPGLGGIGVFVNENNGDIWFIRELQIGVSVSTRIKFSSLVTAQVGLKASVIHKKIAWNDFVFSDQLSEEYGNFYQSGFAGADKETRSFPDVGLGVIVQYKNRSGSFNGTSGVAVDHLLEPNQSFFSSQESLLSRKYVLHSNFIIKTKECSTCKLKGSGFSDPLMIQPGFLYQYQHNGSNVNIGCNLTKFNFTLGLWACHHEQSLTYEKYSFLLGYRVFFSKAVSVNITYSVDFANRYSIDKPLDTHEFCLLFNFSTLK